jgi:hypothetical protein
MSTALVLFTGILLVAFNAFSLWRWTSGVPESERWNRLQDRLHARRPALFEASEVVSRRGLMMNAVGVILGGVLVVAGLVSWAID